jgi:hypothetical protein
MAELVIRIQYPWGRRGTRWLMVGALFFASVPELASESVTLTTYYPAPSGVYTQMITTSNTYLARDGGNVGVGTTAMQGRLDVVGWPGSNTIVARPSSDSDAIRVTPNANNQGSVAFGVTNAANSAWTAYMLKRGDGYFAGSVGIGKTSPGVRLDVVNGGAIRVGVATLSDGGNYYMHLSNHEYYNGGSWVADGQPGVLLQFSGQSTNFYTHNGFGSHTYMGGFNPSADFNAQRDISASRDVTSGRDVVSAHYVTTGGNACWSVNVNPNGTAPGCPSGDYLTTMGNFYTTYVSVPFHKDYNGAQMVMDALCCPCPASGCRF